MLSIASAALSLCKEATGGSNHLPQMWARHRMSRPCSLAMGAQLADSLGTGIEAAALQQHKAGCCQPEEADSQARIN